LTRTRTAILLVAFAALVAYLSFVPFRYQPLGFDEALARFAGIPYLDLGAGSRADWVANILMFVPLGGLAAAFFVPHPRRRADFLAVIPSLLLGAAWALVLEFGQLYFPNRTVSINDIVAELIGTALGATLWCAFGGVSLDWWRTLTRGGRATANAVLAAYLLAYLVLSFSPFDFVISADELAERAASNLNGWWLAPIGCGQTPCSAKLFAEGLAVLPVGWWLARRRGAGPGSVFIAGVLGAGLGFLIEAAQFLLVSGTSQGASVAARTAGVAGGAWLYSARGRILGFDWVRWGRVLTLAGLVPWLIALALVSGWFGGRWLGLEAGLSRLEQVRWMPFYYQYYSTEQALIRSTLVHLVLYSPAGVAVWLWGRRTNSARGWTAALLAGAVAVVAETGKLFVQGRHPDYTDVLFAMAAAWITATLLRRASEATRREPVAMPDHAARQRMDAASMRTAPQAIVGPLSDREGIGVGGASAARGVPASRAGRAAGFVALLLVLVSLARFPVFQLPLTIGLVAYAALLARWPLAYVIVVPSALPLLDLAPYSGRFFWDEFDLLFMTTLGVRWLTSRPQERITLRVPVMPLALLATSVLASALITLSSPAPLDANAFASYLSPYNALRVAKGYLWCGVLFWLLWRDAAAGRAVAAFLQLGLGGGLLAAVIGVFWERLTFVGFAGLGAGFRAAGFVSATHVGGAYLEAILVTLAPFSLALALTARRLTASAFWYVVTALGAVAVLMTLSRAAAAAWLIGIAVFAVLWGFGSPSSAHASAGRRRWIGLAATAVALLGVGALMAQSGSLRDRIAGSGADLGVRLAHWRTTLDLMRGHPLQGIFGMGLGSFPREFYLAQTASTRPPAYRLEPDAAGGRNVLVLLGGKGMYLDQRVAATAGRELRLRGLVRSSRENAELAVALCEKSFLASVQCDWSRVAAATDWQPFDLALTLRTAVPARSGPAAPVSLSLHNGASGLRIEVTGLSLRDGPTELLANGAFDRGSDRWLMHSDFHLAWRAHSTPLQIAFEQGMFGLLAWTALGFAATVAVVRRSGDLPAAALAAATAFLAVGCFDTLLDAPRLVVLAGLVLWLILGAEERISPAGGRPRLI
jgi:VanZ family protein